MDTQTSSSSQLRLGSWAVIVLTLLSVLFSVVLVNAPLKWGIPCEIRRAVMEEPDAPPLTPAEQATCDQERKVGDMLYLLGLASAGLSLLTLAGSIIVMGRGMVVPALNWLYGLVILLNLFSLFFRLFLQGDFDGTSAIFVFAFNGIALVSLIVLTMRLGSRLSR